MPGRGNHTDNAERTVVAAESPMMSRETRDLCCSEEWAADSKPYPWPAACGNIKSDTVPGGMPMTCLPAPVTAALDPGGTSQRCAWQESRP